MARAKAEKFAAFDALARSEATPIRPERLVADLEAVLPEDAVVVADPGTPCPYLAGYYRVAKTGRHMFSNRAHGALGYSLPAALAQGKGAPGDFISVVAKPSSQSYDVIYLLDTRSERLHAIYPSNLQQRSYGYGGSVDLKADFGE